MMATGSKNHISLVMIARNEERCIERCLLSAAPYVDRMIVLDTGSTDATTAIAQACGATVHQGSWDNDFSHARNLALEIANADFNLVLDADEWIISGGESLNRATLAARSIGEICIRSESESAGERQVCNSWIPRLLPRGVRYIGRVHEQPLSELPHIRLPLMIGHDGYMPSQMQAKRGRNSALLHEALKSAPYDPYLLYSLGREYEAEDRYTEACELYSRAASVKDFTVPYRLDLDYRYLDMLLRSGRIEECLIESAEMMERWGDVPDYFFILGYVFLEGAKRNRQNANDYWLPLAENAWRRCLEIGERPDLDGCVVGRGSFLAEHNLSVMLNLRNT